MRYFARAKPSSQYLKPGEWGELTEAQYESLKKSVKATSGNFLKGGVEGLVVSPGVFSVYEHVYPELYALLTKKDTS